ncbi:MAG: serine hydrolase [Pseudomonadales bacterium]|nr:serine hydrolase [Pseudomonadales bacterium]
MPDRRGDLPGGMLRRLRHGVCLSLVLVGVAAWAAPDPAKLELASVQALVARIDEETPLYARHADRAVPIASVTKLMTALVVLESGEPLDAWLEIVDWESKPPNNAYSRMRIGSELRRRDLVRIALMSSENLATHVLARHHPGGVAAFVAAMNGTAERLGMTRSRFVDPAGLSPLNVASAADLLRLLRVAWTQDAMRSFTTTTQYSAVFRKPRYVLAYGNTNPLVASSRYDVGLSKTGYLDEAGRCLATVTMIDGAPVAMVLLDSFGSRSYLGDVGRIRRWLETGVGGPVARAARAYADARNAAYSAPEATSSQ